MNIKIAINGRSLQMAINENALFSDSKESYFKTSQEEIDKCLCCKYSFCNDCLSKKNKKTDKGKGRPSKFDEKKLKELLRDGKKNKEICKELKISEVSLIKYKKLLYDEF